MPSLLRMAKRTALRLLPSRVQSQLRNWRYRRTIDNYPAHVVEHTYGSRRFQVYLADPLGENWYDMDWPELAEMTELRQTHLCKGARVFDIGSHQGIVAMMLADIVGSGGQVVSVEPSEHNVRVAVNNRDLNGLRQIEVVRAAIAEHAGTIEFSDAKGTLDDGTGAWGRQTVEAVTIDGLAERYGPPAVVLIDVDGAELMALAGAPKVLASGADFVVEVHVGCGLEAFGGTVEDLLGYFPPDRFRLSVRADHEPKFRPLQQNDPLLRRRFFLMCQPIGQA